MTHLLTPGDRRREAVAYADNPVRRFAEKVVQLRAARLWLPNLSAEFVEAEIVALERDIVEAMTGEDSKAGNGGYRDRSGISRRISFKI